MGGDSVFTDTQLAQMGDLGSVVLKPVSTALQANWTVGQAVDVAWGMRYSESSCVEHAFVSLICSVTISLVVPVSQTTAEAISTGCALQTLNSLRNASSRLL